MILELINSNTREPFATVLADLLKSLNVPISNHTTPFIRSAPSIAGSARAAIPTRAMVARNIEPTLLDINFNVTAPLLISLWCLFTFLNTAIRPPLPVLPPRNIFSIAFAPHWAGFDMTHTLPSFFTISIDELMKLIVASASF